MSEVFAKFLRSEEIVLKYAKGMRDIFGKEIHSYHEIFFFLGGDAEFSSDEGKFRLEPDTAVVIPKGTFHQFTVYGAEEDYHRLVLSFDGVSGLDELFPSALEKIQIIQDDTVRGLFSELRYLAEHPLTQAENVVLLKAFLAQITVRVCHAEPVSREGYRSLKPLTQSAISYINRNIKTEMTVKEIADVLHVSPSYLAHNFQKDMRISLHRYILQKRLMLANRMIGSGTPSMQAAMECGFHEYSGFYRQYKKMFDVPPSGTEILRIRQTDA